MRPIEELEQYLHLDKHFAETLYLSEGELTQTLELAIVSKEELKNSSLHKLCRTVELAKFKIEGLKEKIASLRSEKKHLENALEAIRSRMSSTMKHYGVSKISGSNGIGFQNVLKTSTSVDITNLEEIPKEFFDLAPKLNSERLKAALEAGLDVPGAQLIKSESYVTGPKLLEPNLLERAKP